MSKVPAEQRWKVADHVAADQPRPPDAPALPYGGGTVLAPRQGRSGRWQLSAWPKTG